MIHRVISIGHWMVDFLFAVDDYDDEVVLSCLYDMDASYDIMRRVNRMMDSEKPNCGFTFSNIDLKRALVVVGPTTSHKQFLNTLVHELHHVAVAIADSLGVDLESETPAYIVGDSALALADTICRLGCPDCDED